MKLVHKGNLISFYDSNGCLNFDQPKTMWEGVGEMRELCLSCSKLGHCNMRIFDTIMCIYWIPEDVL